MAIDSERLVKIYLKMRQAKSDLKKEFEAKEAKISADMETVEGLLMGVLVQNKAHSMATEAGTFFVQKSIKPSCNDWHAYHTWLIERGDLSGLEKRVTKNFIVDYMKDNQDKLPPGITTYEEQVVRVRVGNN